MDSIAIHGGAQLFGDIPVSGAKNSAIKLMAASILTDQPLLLTNMPRLADTRFLGQLLRQFGVEVTKRDGADGQESLFHAKDLTSTFAPYDLVRQMRASFNVLGPLLARTGEAKVSLPGGCTIGARPVDLHLQALTALGAEIELEEGYVTARAPKGLRGAEIEFPFVSVGATEHALLAAVLAQGTTVLRRAAREPEIGDLAHCLTAMGARIEGIDTDVLTITGVSSLNGATWSVIPDRIEMGSYAVAAAMAGGEVRLTKARAELISSLTDKMIEAGVEVSPTADGGADQARSEAAAEGRGRGDRHLSRLRHRPAGAVHGPDDDRRGRQHGARDHLREPFHARGRNWRVWAPKFRSTPARPR